MPIITGTAALITVGKLILKCTIIYIRNHTIYFTILPKVEKQLLQCSEVLNKANEYIVEYNAYKKDIQKKQKDFTM